MSTVKELEAQLAAAKKAEREQEEERSKARAVRLKALLDDPDSWEWNVEPGERTDFMSKEKYQGAHVTRRVKPELAAAWRAAEGVGVGEDYENWRGMFYRRTDENILTSVTGGWLVLKTPKLCSDAEWAEIISGNIPMKYRR